MVLCRKSATIGLTANQVVTDRIRLTPDVCDSPNEVPLRYGDVVSRLPAIFRAVAMGVGASLVMDLWNLFLARAFRIPSLNYCLLGRWLCHMPSGTVRHPNIGAAAHRPLECAVGWTAHYTIGVAFALAFVAFMSSEWLAHPTLAPALLYGMGTVVFPFFIMQPSLGLGMAASRTPHPAQARLKSFATHTVFGIGLYACALAWSWAPWAGHAR